MYCYTNLPPVYQDVSWLIHRNISEHCFLSPLTLSELRANLHILMDSDLVQPAPQ